MANKTGIASLGPYVIRDQSGLLVQPNEIASKIENMIPTEEGSLRSVHGPAALVDTFDPPQPEPGFVGISDIDHMRPKSSSTEFTVGNYATNIIYGDRLYGIYHCLLSDNERDVLLLHTEDELWEFTGWTRGWRKLVSDDITSGEFGYSVQLETIDQPQFPTQFACTGTGVVIAPQTSRPLYYDGHKIGPLGFESRPAPPQGMGPSNSAATITARGVGVNDRGYCHDGTPYETARNNYRTGSTEGFGSFRVGTTSGVNYDVTAFTTVAIGGGQSPLTTAGWLLPGEWRCKVQFIDQFGNLSAPSAPSDVLPISYQPSLIPDPDNTDAGGPSVTVALELLRKQVAWTGIQKGPEGTIGRVLYRTKDLLNSGDGNFYYLPQDAVGVLGSYATMPDNITNMYPDNISDSALVSPEDHIVPAPRFKLCALAFGRLWVANTQDNPNLVQASLPGRWGTFSGDVKLYPDPVSEVTGIHACNQGLLVFTMRGTHLIGPQTDAINFALVPISSEVGCVAPSSIQTLPGGKVVWLGDDGFYSFDGSSLEYASAPLRRDFRRLTKTRMKQACSVYDPQAREYRCWVSVNGSKRNNMCFIFDGAGWRTRTDTKASAACVTKDHRNLVLVAGEVRTDSGHAGVYAVDRGHNRQDTELNEIIDSRTAVIETGWMSSQTSLDRKTTRVVYLWLRETEDSDITIEVLRDWRNEVIETVTTSRYSSEDPPSFWGQTKFGESSASFVSRRPYWARAQVYIPSNEVFKFRIKGSGLWEFIGLQVDVAPRAYGGAQVPP